MDPKFILPGLVAIGVAVWMLGGDGLTLSLDPGSQMRTVGATKAGVEFDGTNPQVLRKEEPYGWVTRSPGVVMANDATAVLTDLVDGHRPQDAMALPASLERLALPESCAFRKPKPSEHLAPVMVLFPAQDSPVHAYDENRLIDAALKGLRAHKETLGEKLPPGASVAEVPGGTRLGIVDVIVSQTDAPVYLVLQSRGGSVLWNLLPMPGVTLAHVAVLGRGAAGVMNVPDGVPVQGGVPAEDGPCGVVPELKPDPTEKAARQGGGKVAGSIAKDRNARYKPYAKWFRATFGAAPETNLIHHGALAHVLVGPMPAPGAAKAQWRSTDGARVMVTARDITYAASDADHQTWALARLRGILAGAFGVPETTDIAGLVRPVVIERAN